MQARRGSRLHGRIETETWNDKETQERRIRDVVRVAELGPSLKWATAAVAKNPAPKKP